FSFGRKVMTARREFLAACAALGGAALAGCAGTETQKSGRRYARVIDAHAHLYPREFVTLMEKEGPANGAKMGTDKAGNPVVLSVPGGTQASSMRRNMIELDLLIKEMDGREVDMYALSMTNPLGPARIRVEALPGGERCRLGGAPQASAALRQHHHAADA